MKKIPLNPNIPGDFGQAIHKFNEIFLDLFRNNNEVVDGSMFQVASVSAAYTQASNISFIIVDATVSGFAVTLLSPKKTRNKLVVVKKKDTTANAVTVTPEDGLIEGGASRTLNTSLQTETYISDGTNYWKV